MAIDVDHQAALATLDEELNLLLPPEYQCVYDDVQPLSMGSADLKYGTDGKVAWNDMWATFCDLAMAGGPPHKGTLLEPARADAIADNPVRYETVVREICRGVRMVSGLTVQASPVPGWIRVTCPTGAMAGWVLRAIVMENVSARADGIALDLPAGPGYRIEKEIKNVVTVIAKTSHYWLGHMPRQQQRAIGRFFVTLAQESSLVVPAIFSDVDADSDALTGMADSIHRATGLARSEHRYTGWLGLRTPSVRAAIWMMRAMVVHNVLARREGTVLFVPMNPAQDPGGERVVGILSHVHALASSAGAC